jgi:hypothetical protein
VQRQVVCGPAKLKFMSADEVEVVEAELVEPPRASVIEREGAQIEAIVEAARSKLTRYLPRAVEILTELAETSENDRVRLAAAESIADRAGLGKSQTTQVNVSASEHEAARRDAEDLAMRMQAQKAVKPVVKPDLDALIVLEGQDDA